ncbi:MAG: ribonuclease E activity regulator RraA [Thiotrichales bacterium]|nr:ribonuclease E activity regulator RraA [Thiotrichales bacterium]
MTFTTADLYDEHGEDLRVAMPVFRDYGGKTSFSGPISTVKCFEDNSLVRTALEEPGDGRVLLVDGGESMRCALVGDMLARLGADNGWAGVIVSGCVRDSVVMRDIAIGIKAMATNPRKSVKQGVGERDVAVSIAGIDCRPGEYVYADPDGVVISEASLNE